MNEAQHGSGLVERSYDREHIQAIRVYFGSETMDATKWVLGPGGSLCGCHSVVVGKGNVLVVCDPWFG